MSRIWLVGLAVAAVAPAAWAQTSVGAARAAGVVGERFDGYLGFVGQAPPAVRTQVSAINIRRRALYTSLAASRGVTPSEVGIAAACELLARVGVGQAYMLSDGAWRRRAPGQSAPLPDYCR